MLGMTQYLNFLMESGNLHINYKDLLELLYSDAERHERMGDEDVAEYIRKLIYRVSESVATSRRAT
jgi:hypothetical protein